MEATLQQPRRQRQRRRRLQQQRRQGRGFQQKREAADELAAPLVEEIPDYDYEEVEPFKVGVFLLASTATFGVLWWLIPCGR